MQEDLWGNFQYEHLALILLLMMRGNEGEGAASIGEYCMALPANERT